ncbi:uncharacterized protein LOC143909664 [Arctopsyche grandis]|uniref:uncharacterized protein LOC143909664 n=1 Tax=Arctopsyche grandis TaxID=121162 RepID=UPI00406D722C
MSEELIEAVQQYECLYNKKCEEYGDHSTRNFAWKEVSKQLNIPVSQCKSDWTKLRHCYINAMRRLVKKSGNPHSIITPWKYEKAMSFLSSSIDVTHNISKHDIHKHNMPSRYSNANELLIKRAKSSEDKQFDNIFKLLRDLTGLQQKEMEKKGSTDETDLFFLSMSQSLKKLPKFEQLNIKFGLHGAINEATLRHINN